MPDNELINKMLESATTGSRDAIAYLINTYRPVVLDIISSLDIKDNQDDFIQEGINAILCAIYECNFGLFSFDSHVREKIESKLKAFKEDYYQDYEHLENVNILPNKLNGENIYESEDSLVDAVGNLDCAVICDGEFSSVLNTFVSSNSDTEKEAINNILRDELKKLFAENDLINLEIEFLKYKYGFYGYCVTVEEIGSEFGMLPQDVERVLDGALFKLRLSKSIKKFAEYMENPKSSLDYINFFQKKTLHDDEEIDSSFSTNGIAENYGVQLLQKK